MLSFLVFCVVSLVHSSYLEECDVLCAILNHFRGVATKRERGVGTTQRTRHGREGEERDIFGYLCIVCLLAGPCVCMSWLQLAWVVELGCTELNWSFRWLFWRTQQSRLTGTTNVTTLTTKRGMSRERITLSMWRQSWLYVNSWRNNEIVKTLTVHQKNQKQRWPLLAQSIVYNWSIISFSSSVICLSLSYGSCCANCVECASNPMNSSSSISAWSLDGFVGSTSDGWLDSTSTAEYVPFIERKPWPASGCSMGPLHISFKSPRSQAIGTMTPRVVGTR